MTEIDIVFIMGCLVGAFCFWCIITLIDGFDGEG